VSSQFSSIPPREGVISAPRNFTCLHARVSRLIETTQIECSWCWKFLSSMAHHSKLSITANHSKTYQSFSSSFEASVSNFLTPSREDMVYAKFYVLCACLAFLLRQHQSKAPDLMNCWIFLYKMAHHQHQVQYQITFSFMVVSKRDHRVNSFDDRQSQLGSLLLKVTHNQSFRLMAWCQWREVRYENPSSSDACGKLVSASFETNALDASWCDCAIDRGHYIALCRFQEMRGDKFLSNKSI